MVREFVFDNQVMIGDFRHATLLPGVDSAIFAHPTALTKLALFIMDAIAHQKVSHCLVCDLQKVCTCMLLYMYRVSYSATQG